MRKSGDEEKMRSRKPHPATTISPTTRPATLRTARRVNGDNSSCSDAVRAPSRPSSAATAGGTARRCPDISKLAALGYAPQVSLAKGLPPTVDWYWANDRLAPQP